MGTTLEGIGATSDTTRRIPRRRRLAGALVVMGLAVGAIGIAPGTASAATTSNGYAGYTANDYAVGKDRFVVDGGRTVYESPRYANQQQKVCVTTQLWQVVYAGYGTGQSAFWKSVNAHTRCAIISPAGTYMRDNGVYFTVSGGGFYSITADIRWYATNGAQIGSTFADYASTSDYVCSQGVWRCNLGYTNWGTRHAYINFQ